MESVDLVSWLVCAAPIVALAIALTVGKRTVPQAAAIGLAFAIASVYLLPSGGIYDPVGTPGESFGSYGVNVGLDVLAFGLLILRDAGLGIQQALSILYAIWPAIILYDLMREGGAFRSISRAVGSLTGDRLAAILVFGWVFSSFLQSITGFGVPVAVCAPFLVALGLRPVPAVALTLIGHSWGNTFGTLAMAWNVLLMVPGLDATSTAFVTTALLWLLNASAGVIICVAVGGRRALAHGLPLVAALSCVMGGGQMLVAGANQTIAAFIPTTVALALCVALFKCGLYARPWTCTSRLFAGFDAHGEGAAPATQGAAPSIGISVAPFAFLAAASLALFAVPGAGAAVSGVAIAGIPLVDHAGFVLTATCVFAYVLFRKRELLDRESSRRALRAALGRLGGVSAGIVLLLVMARVMQTNGQMTLLAQGVAAATGEFYLPFATLVGTFGAFVTSSNMSSNILLVTFQARMADALGVAPSLLLAAQTAGGAAGAAIGPSTILLGAATVGARGKEGEILKPLLAVSLAQSLALGLVVGALAL